MAQTFVSEEEMLQAMVEVIEKSTGLVLDQQETKELLLEIQREQLKGLVYRAFMTVNQAREPVVSEQQEPTTGETEHGAG